MGVSKYSGTPKWMVYNGKPYYQMDDLAGKPTIYGNTHIREIKKRATGGLFRVSFLGGLYQGMITTTLSHDARALIKTVDVNVMTYTQKFNQKWPYLKGVTFSKL